MHGLLYYSFSMAGTISGYYELGTSDKLRIPLSLIIRILPGEKEKSLIVIVGMEC
jgi:hypothetical protein